MFTICLYHLTPRALPCRFDDDDTWQHEISSAARERRAMSSPSPPPSSEKKRPKPGMLKRLFSSRLLNIADLTLDDPPVTPQRKPKKLTRSRTCDAIKVNRSISNDNKMPRRQGSLSGIPQRQHSAPAGHPPHRHVSKPEIGLSGGATTSKAGEDPTRRRERAIAEEDEDDAMRNLLHPTGDVRKPPKRNSSFARLRKNKSLVRSVSDAKLREPLEYPCVPELMLEHHKREPLLNPTEEWLLMELNEYECLIDSLHVVQLMAKHSKFFEVEPPELVDEFFAYVDSMPSYDEVINLDTWQEFRDVKYLC